MLGNDVVDLLDVDARPETFRRRFEERVFAAEERQAVARAVDPDALRWAHWGAKEAAYKLIRQCDPRFVFSPVRLVARFEPIAPAAGGQLLRRGRLELAPRPEAGSGPPAAPSSIELRSFETRDYVHVVALPSGSDWATVALAVESIEGRPEDPSLAVRRLALRELGRELGVAPERLSIGRRDRIPTVELDGRTTRLSLSLSHHGRFVACAIAPRGRLANVWQTTGSVGCPVRAVDTVWMVG